MQSFFDWCARTKPKPSRPWLILGKGPSFAKLADFDISPYLVLSLNHVVRELKVDVAHIIDYDVVAHCGESLLQNARVLVMPWHPHIHNRPSSESLERLTRDDPILERLEREGRLLWYNLSTTKKHHSDSPVVRVKYFSAEAAINLLATAGVRHVRSLGIDGGAVYSTAFEDLKGKTLLANSRTSFDEQFSEIARSILNTGVDYAPLDIESPIRVFVAATEEQMLAVKVLEYSIRKHTSMSVTVSPMHMAGMDMPVPRDPKNQPRTPFSFQRFLIPQLMGWKGRAIYLDSDMQVFQDMRALWILPFNGAQLLAAREPGHTNRKPQFSVMLLDCSALEWRIDDIVQRLDAGELSYEGLMQDMKVASNIAADIDPKWNSLERYDPPETALVHYTDMNTQPWVSRRNVLGPLWMNDLFEAVDGGFITEEFIGKHVQRGWVRPSLLWQLKRRVADTVSLPREAQRLDRDFDAPYKFLPKQSSGPNNDQTDKVRKGDASQVMLGRLGQRLMRAIRVRLF